MNRERAARMEQRDSLRILVSTVDPCVRIKLTFMSSIFNADHTSVLSALVTER